MTQDRLKRLLCYDPITGEFRWLLKRSGVRAGAVCGRVNPEGYREISVDNVLVRANRLAVFYMTGQWPVDEIDHRNRVKNDNRWENLRSASRVQNAANVGVRPCNTTGVLGVVWDKDRSKWRAQIRIGGKKTNLGRFDRKLDAVNAYNEAAAREFGEFAYLNAD